MWENDPFLFRDVLFDSSAVVIIDIRLISYAPTADKITVIYGLASDRTISSL